MKNNLHGFTLVELMVAITIIAILTAVLSANFSDARAQSRDKARLTSLKELQLAVELYKAQNDSYPDAGCGASDSDFADESCDDYISNLVPDFIAELPNDPSGAEAGKGFQYRSDGNSYKILVSETVELDTVSEGDEYARCPNADTCFGGSIPTKTYAVYSLGAENW